MQLIVDLQRRPTVAAAGEHHAKRLHPAVIHALHLELHELLLDLFVFFSVLELPRHLRLEEKDVLFVVDASNKAIRTVEIVTHNRANLQAVIIELLCLMRLGVSATSTRAQEREMARAQYDQIKLAHTAYDVLLVDIHHVLGQCVPQEDCPSC
jgi:hypothetical protein